MSDFTDFFASGGGNITERISYYADGRTIAANQGNITVPNISATTDITSTTTVDWPGTNIDYTPPAGTKYVHYNASLMTRYYNDANMAPGWVVYFDGTEIVATRGGELQQNSYEQQVHADLVMEITGGSDNYAAQQIGTWTSNKTIKVKVGCYNSSYEFAVNGIHHYLGSATNDICQPVITITSFK